MLSLSNCTRIKVYQKPDEALLQPIPKPQLQGKTPRDLGKAFVERGVVIDKLNARLKTLGELE